MASPATLLCISPAFYLRRPLVVFSGYYSDPGVWKRAGKGLPFRRCNAMSKPLRQGTVRNDLQVLQWPELLPQEYDEDEDVVKVLETKEVREAILSIKTTLGSLDNGEISVSAYDTAWVALVQDIHGSGSPQFPTSLEWIVGNQLSDGSWGDPYVFTAHDRIINTLACVIALTSWKVHPQICKKGISYLEENMCRLGDEDAEHMPIGFEVVFPSLLEMARHLGLKVAYDSQVLQDIHVQRNLKVNRIPKDLMHKVPTTLLYSLEGMTDLDWEKLLKLQFPNGSFLFSPASTAFALMQTKDEKCLRYLNSTLERFNGGVPSVYPVDLFERLWVVDRLERLGVSRYFESEIKECLDYVYRYWTEDGICWARNSRVLDVDDTSMGFRLLRLHGYDVSADAFRQFEKGGEFFCFAGQSNQAVTGIFNLNRASQLLLPGEKILQDAKTFSFNFLSEKQASKQLLDKWIIMKDLAGEVKYALDFPWYASLPRIETRFYVEQYGGEDDVWIGKTLYRMPNVNNNRYLELAKLDFNNCQALHQQEWLGFQKWYSEGSSGELGVSKKELLKAYFLAASNMFEPERWTGRLAWARTSVLLQAISSYFEGCTAYQLKAFIEAFRATDSGPGWKGIRKGLLRTMLQTLDNLSRETLKAHGRVVYHQLRDIWEAWMLTWQPQGDKDDHPAPGSSEAELLVRTIVVCTGQPVPEEMLSHPHYLHMAHLTNTLCHHLRRVPFRKKAQKKYSYSIESEMQALVQCVLSKSVGIDADIKQTFLAVTKSYYYAAYCTPTTLNHHIVKVLFQRVG